MSTFDAESVMGRFKKYKRGIIAGELHPTHPTATRLILRTRGRHVRKIMVLE